MRLLKPIVLIGLPTMFLVFVFAIVVPAILDARQVARRVQWIGQLKQLGLAMHNYHDCYNTLPPGGIFRADGEAMHGWPTVILPFVDANPFYSTIDFHKPWDDPIQLGRFFDAEVREYVGLERLFTSVQLKMSRGPMIPLHVAANSWLMHRNSSIRIIDIEEKAGTMLLADSSAPYDVFGSPFNWRNPKLTRGVSPAAFGNIFPDRTTVIFVDAHTETIPIGDNVRWKLLSGEDRFDPDPILVERPTEAWELGDRPHDPIPPRRLSDGK